MRASSLAPVLMLWSSAYLGGALFLIAGLLPRGSVPVELLTQLSWLALIASVPTTLVLAAVSRLARAPRALISASTVAVFVLTATLGTDHVDFLLAGPQWLDHPRRGLLRIAMASALGALAALGWLWLILGSRIRSGRRLAVWIGVSFVSVGILTAAMMRYRAYDYSIAQLVFPAVVLSAAILHLLLRDSSRQGVAIGLAAACFLFGAVSRFSPTLRTTGQRQVIAQSRAGALASLYVLPHLRREASLSENGATCPEAKPVVETSQIGIAPEGRRNVVIITVDALREDVVGSDVNGRPVTPELSRLARQGVSFSNARSTYPATLFAIGSAFTGLSPAELYLSPALPDTIFTRSRTLVDRQFAILPDAKWFRLPIVEQFLAPGVQSALARNDTAATDALVSRLRRARRDEASVMAWIHYYAPHDPYESQPEFPFGKGKKNAYLSEVSSFDRELGRLMGYLQEDGWLDDTLVVFFSDHGEALGEQAYWGHHVYLNDWMINVPLLLWHAAFEPAQPQVEVSLSDVAPSVLHFLGLPIPSDIAARSLFTLDPNMPDRATFSEAFPVRGRELFDSFRLPALDDETIRARLRSIRVSSKGYEPKGAVSRGPYRLIHHRSADAVFLFDQEGRPDPEASKPEVRESLIKELAHWEQAQLRRIECRLQLSESRPSTPRPQ